MSGRRAKSRWSVASWWRSALTPLAVGGAAAGAAYWIGAGLRGLVAQAARVPPVGLRLRATVPVP